MKQIEIFMQIVNQVNSVGLATLIPDVKEDSDEISMQAFLNFVLQKLQVKLPEEYKKIEVFEKFVKHRIIHLKEFQINDG